MEVQVDRLPAKSSDLAYTAFVELIEAVKEIPEPSNCDFDPLPMPAVQLTSEKKNKFAVSLDEVPVITGAAFDEGEVGLKAPNEGADGATVSCV